jgi:hypothetical protein
MAEKDIPEILQGGHEGAKRKIHRNILRERPEPSPAEEPVKKTKEMKK